MARAETIIFEFRQYQAGLQTFGNDLVAQLPGLLITQFALPEGKASGLVADKMALRFDFVDDWYSVLAFLDDTKHPTGHYKISIQTPLTNEGGIWKGDDLLLGLEIRPDFGYVTTGEEEFLSAVEKGWMRVYTAANAREALRKLCLMLDDGRLPQEVMDAIHG